MVDTISINELVSLLRSALVNLYDSSYLETHELAETLLPARGPRPGRTRAQEVRMALLDAIERLSPSNCQDAQARASRPYQVLYQLYIEGLAPAEIAARLAVGERQLRRDRSRALEALAAIVRDEYIQQVAPQGDVGKGDAEQRALHGELERMRENRSRLELGDLLRILSATIDGLASAHGVVWRVDVSQDTPAIFASRAIIREALLKVLTYWIGVFAHGTLVLSAEARGDSAVVTCRLELPDSALCLSRVAQRNGDKALNFGQELAAAEGATLSLAATARSVTIEMELPTGYRRILVVDDNETVVRLYERYVAEHPFHIVWADNRDKALELARTLSPRLIVLDVMMPDCSGWELLQTLRTMPETCQADLLVCSVVNNPELAHALGASSFIRKPVRQVDFLAALGEFLVSPEERREGGPTVPEGD